MSTMRLHLCENELLCHSLENADLAVNRQFDRKVVGTYRQVKIQAMHSNHVSAQVSSVPGIGSIAG